MIRISRILTVASLLAAMPFVAEARSLHHAKAAPHPAVKARQAAADGFAARMNRLDALMGSGSARTRSASAEH